MKVKNILYEEAKDVVGLTFENSTEDQFPYVESAINSLDNNFNWWKQNWEGVEQILSQRLQKVLKDNGESSKGIKVSSRFTIFHGTDEKVEDVVWTGPVICFTLNGVNPQSVIDLKESFKGIYKGHKIFISDNQFIIMFG